MEGEKIITGNDNAITDVAGIEVGQYTDVAHASGVTVILAAEGAAAGVDVRGAAPGTRETDLLNPDNLVPEVQAVVLSGGSVYGLAAADGVVRRLSERGLGFPLEGGRVAPIVPAAVLFDLGRGKSFIPPVDASWGRMAVDAAGPGAVSTGCAGAGTGAASGGIKGGIGTASVLLDSGVTVGAIVAVNSLGSVIDPRTGRPWEIRAEIEKEFGDRGKWAVELPGDTPASPGTNTTLGVVAADARLTKSEARRVAVMAHDGLARSIRPAHTLFDGDTIFCLSTGKRDLPEIEGFFAVARGAAVNAVGAAAAECIARAVVRAVLDAESLAGITAFRDLPRRKAK
jgi:L-aminopeptidase/D-esterase-like protein